MLRSAVQSRGLGERQHFKRKSDWTGTNRLAAELLSSGRVNLYVRIQLSCSQAGVCKVQLERNTSPCREDGTCKKVRATGEMSKWLSVPTALAENRSPVPGTYVGQLITACKSSPRGSITIF